MRVRNRRLGRIAEADFFPRLFVGEQFAQQLVVEFVAGLVAVERTDQAVADTDAEPLACNDSGESMV